jgi:hypothetical protein
VVGVTHQVDYFAGESFLRRGASFSFSCSSWAKARGESASAAEKLTTTLNLNNFEVPSGEYNIPERPPDLVAVNLL